MNKIIFDDVEYEFQIVPTRKRKENGECLNVENVPISTGGSIAAISNVTEASTVPSCVSSVVPTTTTTKVKTPKTTFALVVGVIANALISVFEMLVNLGVI